MGKPANQEFIVRD